MNTSSQTDGALLAGIVAGNQAAYAALVRRHHDVAYRVAWRVLGGPDDADDVVQEAFVKLWRSPEQIRDQQSVKPWLMRVVSNLAIDRLRRRKPHSDAELPNLVDPSAGPEEDLNRGQLAQRIDEAIARLPPRQRLALVLTYFEGQGNQATAEALETSVEAVESLLSRARRALKGLLAEDGPDMLRNFDDDG